MPIGLSLPAVQGDLANSESRREMPSILDEIVAAKWAAIAAAKSERPGRDLEAALPGLPPAPPFGAALALPGEVRVIAEVKRASPSAGVLRTDFDPAQIARAYEQNGAACVSVLTDEPFFQGHLDHLRRVRAATTLPLLRKEFVLDRYQLLEARLAGASAVLLIAEILPGERLAELHREAVALGLEVLVELHDAHELPRVLDAGTRILGINNRDLRSFHTRLDHTIELMPKVPAGVVAVSESGIRTPADMAKLAASGVHAVLVGEALIRATDPGQALRELRGV